MVSASRAKFLETDSSPILAGDSFKQQSLVPWGAGALSGSVVLGTAGTGPSSGIADLASFTASATSGANGSVTAASIDENNGGTVPHHRPSSAPTHLTAAVMGGAHSASQVTRMSLHDCTGAGRCGRSPGNYGRDRRARVHASTAAAHWVVVHGGLSSEATQLTSRDLWGSGKKTRSDNSQRMEIRLTSALARLRPGRSRH